MTGLGAPWPRPHRLVSRDLLAEHFQRFDIALLTFSVADILQDFQHAAGADPAGCALAAAFILGKFHEEAGHVDHAGFIIHHHHAAGTHHGTGRCRDS